MLDPKALRSSLVEVKDSLLLRGYDLDINLWEKMESSRKELQGSTEELQSELNTISKEIGIKKSQKEDSSELESKASGLTQKIKKRN